MRGELSGNAAVDKQAVVKVRRRQASGRGDNRTAVEAREVRTKRHDEDPTAGS